MQAAGYLEIDKESKAQSLDNFIQKLTHYEIIMQNLHLLNETELHNLEGALDYALSKYKSKYNNQNKEIGQKMDFIAIDFETATSRYSSACSIGLVVVNGIEIVDKHYFLIQPPNNSYNKDNTAIHGLSSEDTKDSELFPRIWEKIKFYFNSNYCVIAHNATFDMKVLKASLDYYNISFPNFYFLCSMSLSGHHCDDVGKSLSERAKYFLADFDESNHHNALYDAETCARIVIECIKKIRWKEKSLDKYLMYYPSTNLKSFSDVKLSLIFGNTFDDKAVKVTEINNLIAQSNIDKLHEFFGKHVAFTGDLKSYSRKDAMTKVVELGGVVAAGVNKKVNYLVDADDYESNKNKRAKELQEQGYDIKIIDEETFLSLIKKVN